VTQALLPPLFAGFVASALAGVFSEEAPWLAWWIVPVWMVLYGCAIHAAGFFMPRGMKLFGWGFILAGCGAAVRFMLSAGSTRWPLAHLLMGFSFGGLHLGYGVYLYFTERKKSEL
jgi:hypothetical protein